MKSVFLFCAALSSTAFAADPKLVEWQLANGLRVILVEEHKAPVVTAQVFYHVGAKDEPADKRGIAHMFEHMMFKGSARVAPEAHARFIDGVGGNDNAFTSEDVTAYHDTVPPSALDFTLELEAERMRHLSLTQKTIDSEREVVKEELRVRVENNPVMQALDKVLHLAYRVHPYQQMAIGQKKMLDSVTIADCQRFYDTYYQPNNALLLLVGDVDEMTARALVDKQFAKIPRGPEIPRVTVKEPEQTALREEVLKVSVQLPVTIGAYHIPAAADADLFALEVLQQILSSGDSSRMYQRLVRKDRSAVAAGGFVFDHEDPGLFVTYGAYLPTSDAKKVRAALEDEIDRIGKTPVTADELSKARNQLAAQAVYRRERVAQLATQIGGDALVSHDASRVFSAAARYDAVTADDLMRVAKKYLRSTNLTVVTLEPTK